MAKSSTHPISQAIGKSSADLVELQDWKEIRGAGVEGKTSDTKTVRLGSVPWLKQSGVALSTGEKFISEWSGQGATIVGLAVGDELAGLFAIRDRLKANAATVVGKLQQRGLEIYLVSGDNWQTATSIARQAGIAAENVFAESLPEQKAELVKKLQAQGKRVAFVGDSALTMRRHSPPGRPRHRGKPRQ